MHIPGERRYAYACLMNAPFLYAMLTIVPHVGWKVSPKPRKLRVDSIMMQLFSPRRNLDTRMSEVFGIVWRTRIWKSEKPSILRFSVKALCFSSITLALTVLAVELQLNTDIRIIRERPPPRMKDPSTIRTTSLGSIAMTSIRPSAMRPMKPSSAARAPTAAPSAREMRLDSKPVTSVVRHYVIA